LADLIIVLYILAGIAVGFVAALIGIGGGFLMVPILHLLFGLEIHAAIGTSLFTIIFTSTSSSGEYVRKGIADLLLGAVMIPFTITGAIIGANLSTKLPGNVLKAFFGILLIIISVRMFLKNNSKGTSASQLNESFKVSPSKFLTLNRTAIHLNGTGHEYAVNIPLVGLFGFCAGLLSGLLGIGGGSIQIPVLTLVFGVPIHVAIATSMFIIMFTSTFGMLTHLFIGNVLLAVGIFVSVGTIIGGQIGARTAQRIDNVKLRKIFAVLMIFAGIRMIFSIFSI
jgi:uncharacterized membrane protein YfcA